MKTSLFAALTLLTIAACTGSSAPPGAKGPGYSQGPTADAHALGARNTPFERSPLRDRTMPATAM